MADIYETDKRKTEQINSSSDFIPCGCHDCQEYYRAVEKLSPEGKNFFDTLGIHLLKCKELWCYHPNDKGCNHYSGYFNVVV